MMNVLHMRSAAVEQAMVNPFIERLHALAPLNDDEAACARDAIGQARRMSARTIVTSENEPAATSRVLLRGFAARSRLLADGRRQILTLLLPGDIIRGVADDMAFVQETIVALTEIDIAPVDLQRLQGDALTLAQERDRALSLVYLHNQVMRLGRQTAYERLAHLMLELRHRLGLAGLIERGEFPMPLTQEILADVLGLTTVHMNRTMQQLRREGMIEGSRNGVTLPQPEALANVADYTTPRL